jgi:hypothetical protein
LPELEIGRFSKSLWHFASECSVFVGRLIIPTNGGRHEYRPRKEARRRFGRNYFYGLLEGIREIRANERSAYQKIADVSEQCGYGYDKDSETTRAFHAFAQNKPHLAVAGKTAAELIPERASIGQPTMGLTTRK